MIYTGLPNVEEFLEKLVTVYGPLALGWVFFWLQWRDCREKERRLTELYMSNAAAMAAFKMTIEERFPSQRRR
jgi:hypothetical protein